MHADYLCKWVHIVFGTDSIGIGVNSFKPTVCPFCGTQVNIADLHQMLHNVVSDQGLQFLFKECYIKI